MTRIAEFLLARYAPHRLYPRPTSGLQPEKLYAYLNALWERRRLDGVVLEVGCHYGGTAALALQMLQNTECLRRYICIDTFSGFVAEQFDWDAFRGTPLRLRDYFATNSLHLTRRLLRRYGCDAIELIQGDVVSVPDEVLPDSVVVCLLDVDLEIPTYEGLKRIYPRLVHGGIILVDDCPDADHHDGNWRARYGYLRFIEEQRLPEEYFMDMGVVTRN